MHKRREEGIKVKLHSLKLKNFRGYKDEINIVFDDLTA